VRKSVPVIVAGVVRRLTSLLYSVAGLSSFLWAKSILSDLPISSSPFSSVTALEARSCEAKSMWANPFDRPRDRIIAVD
jgi:hypothetical protein